MVASQIEKLLLKRQLEPGIIFSQLKIPEKTLESAELGLKFPEIIGIYLYSKGKFSNIYSAYPDPGLEKHSRQFAGLILDTLSFKKANWDSTWMTADACNIFNHQALSFIFLKKGEDIRLYVESSERFKSLLAGILSRAVNDEFGILIDYFKPKAEYSAMAEFYDHQQQCFYKYPEAKKLFWTDEQGLKFAPLDWVIKVHISPRQKALVHSAEAANRFPWFPVAEFIIAGACMLFIGLKAFHTL
jgi:hypothetical protein